MADYNSSKPPTGTTRREALRAKGQFWTPDWVAQAMVGYVVANGCGTIFDPAVGTGAFFRAAKTIADENGIVIDLTGTELYSDALQQARQEGLSENDLAKVQIRDFTLDPPEQLFKAIVANPPYIRHHRLNHDLKGELRKFGESVIGKALDGRAGLHIYFLIRALQLLDIDGRLAFIVPADTCEGVFAPVLWRWIANNYHLEAVVTFTPEASPFPGVDTNPVILMISKTMPQNNFLWAECTTAGTQELKLWTLSQFREGPVSSLSIHKRTLSEGLATGLSRPPNYEIISGPVLAEYATVRRGIATGANEFFFLTVKRATDLEIPNEFLIPAIGRTRDVPNNEITKETINVIRANGRPTLLFCPDGRPIHSFPRSVREYLMKGEMLGLPNRPLIASRQPWYKMEKRKIPPILFAYLGRRNTRFIRNYAGVVPLTGFLCVYPHQNGNRFADKLWEVLQHPKTLAALSWVGKSYGAGAIKVEPRALERLRLPEEVLSRAALPANPTSLQLKLARI